MKHSSRQFGDQFSGFGHQSEKFSRIGACIRCNLTPCNVTTELHIKVRRMERLSPTKEAIDSLTNSPCQCLSKYLENSIENMQTDIGVNS